MGCGIRHVGNIPGRETDIWMQMQGNIQENQGLFSVICGVKMVAAAAFAVAFIRPAGKRYCRFFAAIIFLSKSYGTIFRICNRSCGIYQPGKSSCVHETGRCFLSDIHLRFPDIRCRHRDSESLFVKMLLWVFRETNFHV